MDLKGLEGFIRAKVVTRDRIFFSLNIVLEIPVGSTLFRVRIMAR